MARREGEEGGGYRKVRGKCGGEGEVEGGGEIIFHFPNPPPSRTILFSLSHSRPGIEIVYLYGACGMRNCFLSIITEPLDKCKVYYKVVTLSLHSYGCLIY